MGGKLKTLVELVARIEHAVDSQGDVTEAKSAFFEKTYNFLLNFSMKKCRFGVRIHGQAGTMKYLPRLRTPEEEWKEISQDAIAYTYREFEEKLKAPVTKDRPVFTEDKKVKKYLEKILENQLSNEFQKKINEVGAVSEENKEYGQSKDNKGRVKSQSKRGRPKSGDMAAAASIPYLDDPVSNADDTNDTGIVYFHDRIDVGGICNGSEFRNPEKITLSADLMNRIDQKIDELCSTLPSYKAMLLLTITKEYYANPIDYFDEYARLFEAATGKKTTMNAMTTGRTGLKKRLRTFLLDEIEELKGIT